MLTRSVHPGVLLKDELEELGVSPTEFARQIDVPSNRISQIIAGKRSISGDTALRFGHWFGMKPPFWSNLQAQFDLAQADKETGEAIRHCRQEKLLLWEPISPDLAHEHRGSRRTRIPARYDQVIFGQRRGQPCPLCSSRGVGSL